MKSKSLWELWETSILLHSPPLRSVRGVCQPRLIPNSRLNGSKCSAPSLCGARFFFVLKGVRVNSWNQTLYKSPFTTYGIFYGDRRWVITSLQLNTIVGCPWGIPPTYGHSNSKGVPPYALRPQYDHAIESPERRSIIGFIRLPSGKR